MCQVIIKDVEKNKDFIIYNHILSKSKCNFTIAQLTIELQQYNLYLTDEYVNYVIINKFIRNGLVRQYYDGYVARN